MKKIIQNFLDAEKIAIAGASPNKDNFGKSLMTELGKLGKIIYPVNPLHKEIDGRACIPTVNDLPGDVDSLIMAVPPELTEAIALQCTDSGIKRVWMVRGVGKGAYSEKAHKSFSENQIEVVYGFCPMMFYGKGIHKFHLWLRKTVGTLPGEYQLSPE